MDEQTCAKCEVHCTQQLASSAPEGHRQAIVDKEADAVSVPIQSASVTIEPEDSRCKFWCKIVRAGMELPRPDEVEGANDLPGKYLRCGEEEIFPGDIMLEGEEVHHRKPRGWNYLLTVIDTTRNRVRKNISPRKEHKEAIKAAGLPPHLLPGSGDLAALVRIAHAFRLGIPVPTVE